MQESTLDYIVNTLHVNKMVRFMWARHGRERRREVVMVTGLPRINLSDSERDLANSFLVGIRRINIIALDSAEAFDHHLCQDYFGQPRIEGLDSEEVAAFAVLVNTIAGRLDGKLTAEKFSQGVIEMALAAQERESNPFTLTLPE